MSVATGTLVDFVLHPPIGLLTPTLDGRGPYMGNVTRATWSTTLGPVFTDRPVSSSFGVQLLPHGAIPPRWGSRSGWVSDDGQYDQTVYVPAVAQLVVQHQFPNGAWASTQVVTIDSFPLVVLWEIALPGRIGLLVAPGWALDLFYLLPI